MDNSGITFQHKDVHTIEYQLNKELTNLCEWFVDSKLGIHLGEKTKCTLFDLKLKSQNTLKKQKFLKQLSAGSRCCYSTMLKEKSFFLAKVLFLNEI